MAMLYLAVDLAISVDCSECRHEERHLLSKAKRCEHILPNTVTEQLMYNIHKVTRKLYKSNPTLFDWIADRPPACSGNQQFNLTEPNQY